MSRDITNHDDIIDSRDIIARIEELEGSRKPWVAGCNMPGYMPDSEPCSFETWEDARDAIVSDLEEALELAEGDTELNVEAKGFLVEDIANAIERLNEATDEEPYGETIGNWHYWIVAAENGGFEDASDFEELRALKALADEAEGYAADWHHGETLIRDSYFSTYAQELCEDIGDISKDLPSYIEIDWEATARNIRQDYTSVEFDGVTYWVR